jgi:DNA-binding winged helix-turn-helix (wHTH) protein
LSEKTRPRATFKGLSDTLFVAKETPSQERLRLYEFGPFRLDPTERMLLRGDETVPLTPKAFDTLYLLVRNSGHMLEKDEMIKALWPDTFIEEGSLSNNIFLLRKALGYSPAFIETVPRRGYRFVGAVLQLPHAAPVQLQEAPPGRPELTRFHIPKLLQLFAGVALAVLIAVFSLLLLHRIG